MYQPALITIAHGAGVGFSVIFSAQGLLCRVMVGFEQRYLSAMLVLSFPMWV
jgi:hypothetical protein